jgi:hypothetical protein
MKGPTVVKITTCLGCDLLEKSEQKKDFIPYNEYYCKHIAEYSDGCTYKAPGYIGNDFRGHFVETPKCCPFLKKDDTQ